MKEYATHTKWGIHTVSRVVPNLFSLLVISNSTRGAPLEQLGYKGPASEEGAGIVNSLFQPY